ncbi:hypothetical protein NDU88_010999 [Pleurodeles waltl]|uniref:Uncharacterized protein n=1 Tax=Pleurodeles waltl TaxID=8319 RepID=A0AAV7QVZ0_PLEWA|nr:hypothetical protein NDU88_010999 [Pleurodeles waltl]
MPFSTGSGGGFVPRVLRPARGGLSSGGACGAHWPAVLVGGSVSVLLVAVSWAAVLVAAVALAAVLVAAVSLAAVLAAAVSLAAVLVAVVSWAAVVVAAVSWAAVLVVAVSLAAVQVAAVSWAAVLVAAVSWTVVLVAAVSLAAVLVGVLSTVPVGTDFPFFLCPFPTLDGEAAFFPLPNCSPGRAFGGRCFTLLPPGSGQLLMLLRWGTVRGLAPWHTGCPAAWRTTKLVTAGTTVTADVVAEVLGWDLERRALGD